MGKGPRQAGRLGLDFGTIKCERRPPIARTAALALSLAFRQQAILLSSFSPHQDRLRCGTPRPPALRPAHRYLSTSAWENKPLPLPAGEIVLLPEGFLASRRFLFEWACPPRSASVATESSRILLRAAPEPQPPRT